MPTTCLICCFEADYFLLPPCNHKQLCWKCASNLIEGSTFSCPFCKGTPQGTSCILFVDEQEMKKYTFQQILKKNPFKSAAKSYQYYSNRQVANFIQQSTSLVCRFCTSVFDTINRLKKHLNQVHRKQFCDVCLENKKCLISEQKLYTEGQLIMHMKKGEYSSEGQVILYHPSCQFCKIRFYDIDSFKAHLRVSSHLRCHLCEQNFPKFKYVYYKDYQQIEKHFNKTHFVCQIGTCLTKKLQNVYISEQMLQEHVNRVHSKPGKKSNKPVPNLLLFQADKQEEVEWDKIGKDFYKEFQATQKTFELKNQQHKDTLIDIRQFYPDDIKIGNKMSLQQITYKLQDHLFKNDIKSQVIYFVSVPQFCPLEMSSLTRVQLQKFIREIYDPKYSQPIIEIFFTKKFEYSQMEYFNQVKKKMWSFSPISYYFVFPQLIRFFKDTNPTKQLMDTYYAQSLRSLIITNIYIFHKKNRYSEIFIQLQVQIQSYIYELMLQQKINLQKYQEYLKDLKTTFYQENHLHLFYVEKSKIKNIYHMIQKTKTSQLLKFNWLLKLGLSHQSHKALEDKFYYKTLENCGGWIKNLNLQQIALLYAYSDICLQTLLERSIFCANKLNPQALFLGTILSKIKTCISGKQLTSLRQLEQQSAQLASKLNSSVNQNKKNRGVVINQQDHPTLLSEQKNNGMFKKVQQIQVGWQNGRITSNANIRVNKKHNKTVPQQQEFPQLQLSNKNTNGKQGEQETEQDEFPVFNYMETKDTLNKKEKKIRRYELQEQNSKNPIEKLGLFDKKITENRWNNQNTKKVNHQQKSFDWDKTNTSQWPTLNDTQSKDTQVQLNASKKNKKFRSMQKVQQVEVKQNEMVKPQIAPDQYFIKKKTKQQIRAQQQAFSKKSKKYRQLQDRPPSPQKSVDIEKNEGKKQNKQKEKLSKQQREQKKERKKKVRLDMTDSQQQDRIKQLQKQKEREQKFRKFQEEEKLKQSLKNEVGFQESLISKNNNGGSSIINRLIEQSKKGLEEKQPEIKIKKNRKGKAVVIERKGLGDL